MSIVNKKKSASKSATTKTTPKLDPVLAAQFARINDRLNLLSMFVMNDENANDQFHASIVVGLDDLTEALEELHAVVETAVAR